MPTNKNGSSTTLDTFISEHFGTMSYREMAEACGVSKSTVFNHVRALGLTEATARTQLRAAVERIEEAGPSVENDQLRRLYQLRDMQYAALQEAGPRSLPPLSREYRETLRQIAELQSTPDGLAAPDGGDVAGPMAELLAAIPDLSSLAAMAPDG